MLVLTQQIGSRVFIDVPAGPARRIEVVPVRADCGKVRLGYSADKEVSIARDGVTKKEKPAAADAAA